ncbi:MAG: hypothetical protein ACRDHO_11965 [Actinomycetota bacterium]
MGEQENRTTIERLIQCINDRRIEVMDELFHEDAVMEWPQSVNGSSAVTTAVASTRASRNFRRSRLGGSW